MSAALDRWLTRLYHAVGGSLFLGLCAIVAYAAGDRHRPDRVRSPELLAPELPAPKLLAPKLPAPEVAPGGALRPARVIADLAECTLRDMRRLHGAGPDRHRVTPSFAVDAPPRDRDGRPETIRTEIRGALPCGPALRVEGPSAACIGFPRTGRPQRRPDAVTPFRATCAVVTKGPAGAKTAREP